VQRQPLGRKLGCQSRRKIAIDLDRREVWHAREQRTRQGPLARTDLDDSLARRRSDRLHDPRQHTRVVQEVLPEPLARPYLSSSRIST